MDTLTRRRFLIASGVTGGAALAAGAGVFTLREVLDTARWDKPPNGNTLVLITLYGGNDGLSTVIPYADPALQAARSHLAYSPDELLRLDEHVALNPGLVGFKKLYDAGQLAIVHGVGYPKPNRSHFRSMDIWQTGQPDRPGNTGWLGRWLDQLPGGDPRYAVSFEPVLPPVLAGATRAGAAVTLNGLRLPQAFPAATLAALGKSAAGEPPLQARAAQVFGELVDVDSMVRGLPADAEPSPSEPGDSPKGTPTGGRTALADQLHVIARCVEATVATRVFSASLGGFDFHADEKEPQQNLLRELDQAISGFVDRMGRTDAGRAVVVAIYSEFGRRVRANASEGTDHGTASNVFLLGTRVNGGQYGTPASLTDLDDGDLKFTTDFRDVYASLLARVLDTDPGKVLGGWSNTVPKLLS